MEGQGCGGGLRTAPAAGGRRRNRVPLNGNVFLGRAVWKMGGKMARPSGRASKTETGEKGGGDKQGPGPVTGPARLWLEGVGQKPNKILIFHKFKN